MARFGFNFPLNGFDLNSLVYLFLNGLKVHKGFGLVFVLYKWFGSVWFGFKAKKPNRTGPIARHHFKDPTKSVHHCNVVIHTS